MKRKDIEHRVREASSPRPSPQLRDRVLSAAVVSVPSITWSDRVWFSRTWRLSAVAVVLAVIVLDEMSGVAPSADVPADAIAEAQVIDDASWPPGLPPAVGALLVRRESLSDGRPHRVSPSIEMWLEELMPEGGGE